MLTTTVDGLWVLQAVTGVEQTCPELGLRPLLPWLDTAERALRHPVAAELMAVGALDQAGNADPMVREWLTVLLRRDLGLLVTIGVPGGEPTRAAICRFATWWVVLERHGNLVRLYPAGTASDEAGAGELVVGRCAGRPPRCVPGCLSTPSTPRKVFRPGCFGLRSSSRLSPHWVWPWPSWYRRRGLGRSSG